MKLKSILGLSAIAIFLIVVIYSSFADPDRDQRRSVLGNVYCDKIQKNAVVVESERRIVISDEEFGGTLRKTNYGLVFELFSTDRFVLSGENLRSERARDRSYIRFDPSSKSVALPTMMGNSYIILHEQWCKTVQ